jgi:hypothetical protein
MMAGGIETILVLDFEATCDDAEPELTRLQQTDIHEIIDFVSHRQNVPRPKRPIPISGG